MFPIIRMPIVGSLNYIAGGQGNGVAIIIIAALIVLAVFYTYRKTATILGLGALLMMGHTIVGFLGILSKARADLGAMNKSFSGLGSVMINSVGIEWGWIPLIGGALTVVGAGMASSSIFSDVGGIVQKELEPSASLSVAKADEMIAQYLSNQERLGPRSEGRVTFRKRSA